MKLRKMAEDKEPTKEEKAASDFQKGLLEDSASKDFFIAAQGRDVGRYGSVGKQATVNNYLSALQDPSSYSARFLGLPFIQQAQTAIKEGKDIYDNTSVTANQLLDNAKTFYTTGVDALKVGDALALMGIDPEKANVNQNWYLGTLAKKNPELYEKIVGTLFEGIEREGVGQAIERTAIGMRKGLESELKPEEPSK